MILFILSINSGLNITFLKTRLQICGVFLLWVRYTYCKTTFTSPRVQFMALSTFMECDHYHHPCPQLFHLPKLTFCSRCTVTPHHLLPLPSVTHCSTSCPHEVEDTRLLTGTETLPVDCGWSHISVSVPLPLCCWNSPFPRASPPPLNLQGSFQERPPLTINMKQHPHLQPLYSPILPSKHLLSPTHCIHFVCLCMVCLSQQEVNCLRVGPGLLCFLLYPPQQQSSIWCKGDAPKHKYSPHSSWIAREPEISLFFNLKTLGESFVIYLCFFLLACSPNCRPMSYITSIINSQHDGE